MRIFFVLSLCCLTLSSLANPKINNTSNGINQHIRSNMLASYLQYTKQYNACLNQESNILPVAPFKTLKLSDQQLYDVLRYFSLVHFNLCMGDTSNELVKYMSAARAFNIEQINEHDDPTFKLLKEPTRNWVDEIEFEAKYLQIPETTRKKIEQIISLQSPFNMIKSYTAITGINTN